MRLPTLVPTTRSTGIRSCSSTRMTPMCAKPRAAPPPRTSATFGSGMFTTGGGGAGGAAGGAAGGGAIATGGGEVVRHAATSAREARSARSGARRIAPPYRKYDEKLTRSGRYRIVAANGHGHRVDGAPPGPHRSGGHRPEREPEAHER